MVMSSKAISYLQMIDFHLFIDSKNRGRKIEWLVHFENSQKLIVLVPDEVNIDI